MQKTVRTPFLEIGYESGGPTAGPPVVLLHGFPDDVRTWDGVVPHLHAAGCRTFAPYLRGYGPTRFLDAATPRSGQQAALGADLLDFLDALSIDRAILVGYDWGGRAACVAAALRPERVSGLVTICGYNIQDIAASASPAPPEVERRLWYQWYFQSDRGRAGLAANRGPFCRLLWEMWSPNWRFDDATFAATAGSFENPDFVDVVIHSYRHRYRAAPGDPRLEPIEARLATTPTIGVPTIVLHGAADTVVPPEASEDQAAYFPGGHERRVVPVAGHFFPREAPAEVTEAVIQLMRT